MLHSIIAIQPIVRSNIVDLTTNILNPYFLKYFLNIITEGFIPTYYNLIKIGMQGLSLLIMKLEISLKWNTSFLIK